MVKMTEEPEDFEGRWLRGDAMTDDEREFWKAAFLTALPAVIRMPWETGGEPEPGSPENFAFLASRIADESLIVARESDAFAPGAECS